MAIAKYVWIVCNRCTEFMKGAEGMNARAVRAQAKEAKWKLGKKADYCPKCAANLAVEIADAIARVKAGNV